MSSRNHLLLNRQADQPYILHHLLIFLETMCYFRRYLHVFVFYFQPGQCTAPCQGPRRQEKSRGTTWDGQQQIASSHRRELGQVYNQVEADHGRISVIRVRVYNALLNFCTSLLWMLQPRNSQQQCFESSRFYASIRESTWETPTPINIRTGTRNTAGKACGTFKTFLRSPRTELRTPIPQRPVAVFTGSAFLLSRQSSSPVFHPVKVDVRFK